VRALSVAAERLRPHNAEVERTASKPTSHLTGCPNFEATIEEDPSS
jgi:hypothetical protein